MLGALHPGGRQQHCGLVRSQRILLAVPGFVGGVLLVAVSRKGGIGWAEVAAMDGVNGSVGGDCAVAWVAMECLRGWVITGFPWNYLGGSQLDWTSIAMLAQFTGVLGVSLVVAWGSVGGLLVFWRWREQDRFEPALLKDLAGPAALVLVALGLGKWALSQPLAEPRGSLKIALVQPAIPQTVLWNVNDPVSQSNRFEHMMDLSDWAVAKEPDLLVWPEASLPPFWVLNPTNVIRRMEQLEKQSPNRACGGVGRGYGDK